MPCAGARPGASSTSACILPRVRSEGGHDALVWGSQCVPRTASCRQEKGYMAAASEEAILVFIFINNLVKDMERGPY